MTPQKTAAPAGDGGRRGEAKEQQTPDSTAIRAAGGCRRWWPNDTRMVGAVLDREHEDAAGALLEVTRGTTAAAMVETWRRSGNYSFCVVAYSRDGTAIGGLATDWQSAMQLFRRVLRRFDALAEDSTSFSSVWMLFLSGERQAQVKAAIAELQQTVGNA